MTQCPHSVFIFDEVDKMREGIIDAIKPFINHYTAIDGVDYRLAISLQICIISFKLIFQKRYTMHYYVIVLATIGNDCKKTPSGSLINDVTQKGEWVRHFVTTGHEALGISARKLSKLA